MSNPKVLFLSLFLLFSTIVMPTSAVAVVEEVNINSAVVSSWFSQNLARMPVGTSHFAFRSPSNNADVGYTVYFPPGYATSPRNYPVMYWLHGAGGNELTSTHWLPTLIDRAIQTKQIRPMIVVFPNAGGRTMWCDTKNGFLTETMFINELIPLVESKFRVIKDRNAHWLEGFSMGGAGSAKYLYKYPELFSSAVIYGAAVSNKNTIPYLPEFDGAFGSDMDYFNSINWYNAAATYVPSGKISPYAVKLRQVVGGKDMTKADNRRFKKYLNFLELFVDYIDAAGITHNAKDYYSYNGITGFNFH